MIGLNAALRSTRADAIRVAIDTGSPGPSLLRFYDGTRPAFGGTGTNLLAEIALPTPCGLTVAGVLTFSAIPPGTVIKAGTVTWFRMLDKFGTAQLDGSVGQTGDTADIIFTTNVWTVGQALQVTSLVLTEGNAA